MSGNHRVHHLLLQRFINSYNNREQRQRTEEIFIGEVENSEFSENSETSETSEYQFPRFSTPSFRFCPIPPAYTQNRKLGIENLGVSLRHFDQTPSFSNSELSILHYTQTENSELKTSEFSLRHYGQLTSRFSNSEFSILHYTQTENLELKTSEFSLKFTRTTIFLLNCNLIKLRVFPTPRFRFCAILQTENSEMKTLEFNQTALEKTPRFSSPSFPF